MKKIIISLVVILSLTANAFAGDETVDKRVAKAFGKDFSAAKDAKWSVENNMYKVTFTYYDKTISAFYDKKAYLIAVSRYMLSTDLPYYLRKELKEYYNEYWIADLFEISKERGTNYHVVLKNADETLVLSSGENNNWEVFSHSKNS